MRLIEIGDIHAGRDTGDLANSVEDLRALMLSQRALLDEQTACSEDKRTRLGEKEALVIDEQTDRIE